jgi:hypothetical protein
MEAVSFSEMSLSICQAAWLNIPKDSQIQKQGTLGWRYLGKGNKVFPKLWVEAGITLVYFFSGPLHLFAKQCSM